MAATNRVSQLFVTSLSFGIQSMDLSRRQNRMLSSCTLVKACQGSAAASVGVSVALQFNGACAGACM